MKVVISSCTNLLEQVVVIITSSSLHTNITAPLLVAICTPVLYAADNGPSDVNDMETWLKLAGQVTAIQRVLSNPLLHRVVGLVRIQLSVDFNCTT